MALILAGAIGNVIDSTFYGVYLNNAPFGAPTRWFHGQVIDFIFFDLWEGILPRWIPIWGGQYFSMPIFNFADSCIFVGVCLILFFQRRFYQQQAEEEAQQITVDRIDDADVPTETTQAEYESEPVVINNTANDGEEDLTEYKPDEQKPFPVGANVEDTIDKKE